MNPSEEIRNLVDSARKGRADAWRRLEERCRHRLAARLRSGMGARLRQQVEVDDLLQETFFRAFLALEKFEWIGEAAFWSWLGRIADHVVSAEARHQEAAKRRPPEGGQRPLRGWDSPDFGWGGGVARAGERPTSEVARGRERLSRLYRALGGLQPRDGRLIALVSLRGLPVEDAAQVLGCSAAAARMRLVRALRKLRVLYGSVGSSDSLAIPPGVHIDPGGEAESPGGSESSAVEGVGDDVDFP